MRRLLTGAAVVPLAMIALAPTTYAAPQGGQVSGAIFTTDVTGAPVNLNHYAAKQDVYLNGGPGINAPIGAAGLPAGTYTFQVTGPKPTQLLSSDALACRQFTVDGSGVIQSVSPSGACAHATGTSADDPGITVQLYPYADTPNPGGVYKAWVTPTSRLDCGRFAKYGCFNPRYSKTDNFKVLANAIVEIDTRFWKDGNALLGLAAGWTDTVGASNVKYSEYDPAILAYDEAHVEAAEEGTHTITVSDQPGCTIDYVTGPNGERYRNGSGSYSVSVTVAPWNAGDDITYRVEVYCK
ncbi:hypothetical protein ACFUC1_18720 [Pedococcus sp. NPDC057267]|uniref:hypothetical protein n=1 Tax=Pedococcus sp. NPDC057267 TaxID=3346077 RepID=UPI00363E3DDB